MPQPEWDNDEFWDIGNDLTDYYPDEDWEDWEDYQDLLDDIDHF
jgi:hypothetical protein